MGDPPSSKKNAKTPKNKTPLVTPEAKSVKFLKTKTPLSSKKKFAKTPHSSKTLHLAYSDEDLDVSVTPIAEKKKRKLFTEESTDDDASPQSNKRSKFTPKQIAEMVLPDAGSPSATPKPSKKKVLSAEEIKKENTANTVFVGNLPAELSKSEIKKLFAKYGHVSTVRLRCAALSRVAKNRKAGTILKQFEPDSSISAFVKYSSLTGPKAALQLNGKVVKNHHIRVDIVDPNAKSQSFEKNKAVFLRNLPFDLTDDELWNVFSSCGQITSVRVIKDKKTYRGRGLGYVNFDKAGAVELALKMNGSNIKDRPVIVQRWGTRIDEPEDNRKRKNKKLSLGDEDEDQFSSGKKVKKMKKKLKGTGDIGVDFAGNVATEKKKKKAKKPSFEGMKKKKMAHILSH